MIGQDVAGSNRLRLGVVAWGLVVLCLGCATPPPERTEERDIGRERHLHPIEPISPTSDGGSGDLAGWRGGVTALGTVLAAVPHGSIELPAVSPDGRWVAYFRHTAGSPRPSHDSLIHGRDLSGVSLWVRAVDAPQTEEGSRQASPSGACWPAWTQNARSLFFVTYDQPGAASLVRFDVGSGKIERKRLGLRHIMAVQPNPDGTVIALLTYDQDPRGLQLVLVDWSEARLVRLPLRGPRGSAHLMPVWADAQTLLFAEARSAEESEPWADAALMRLPLDASHMPQQIGRLRLPPNPIDALMMQQGILQHFDPRHGAWLYRDHEGQMRQLHLATQQEALLPVGVAAAAWYTDPWLILGGSRDLTLYNGESAVLTGDTDRRVGSIALRLLDGQWAPRWTDADRQTLILVGLGKRAELLALYQLWLAPEVERSGE
ncbi:MAG: hypothetical protein AAGJ38_00885 [Planctomycetota bacterium]